MQVHYSLFGLVYHLFEITLLFKRLQWKTHHGFDVNVYPKASPSGSTYSRDQGTMI